jgi:hypothetical protein
MKRGENDSPSAHTPAEPPTPLRALKWFDIAAERITFHLGKPGEDELLLSAGDIAKLLCGVF